MLQPDTHTMTEVSEVTHSHRLSQNSSTALTAFCDSPGNPTPAGSVGAWTDTRTNVRLYGSLAA